MFTKLVKTKAYFSRYQVKYRRRREGKTDYRARRTLVLQDKTKYTAPKYRLVVRLTNKDVIAQVVHAKVVGDDVIMAAYSHELKAFGIPAGLTSYAAAYATGLLCARRALTKLKIADKFAGVKEATGEFKAVRTKADDDGEEEGAYPFKAILDVGLARTTTGARIFGVMKGAVDGGLAVPHKPNRFPGFNKENGKYDAKAHRARIFGKHVADYMKIVEEEKAGSPDAKLQQFSGFAKLGMKADGIEAMFKKAHAEIRADPLRKVKKAAAPAGAKSKAFNIKKLTHKERKDAAAKKVAALRRKLAN